MYKKIVFIFFIFAFSIFAQNEVKRTSGISASFQDTHLDLIFPLWAGQKTVIAPAVSAVWVEDGGSDLGIGLIFRFYSRTGRVVPYFGGRIGALIASPKNGDSVTDIMAGLLYGGEFFLFPQFSIAIEAQINGFFSHDNSGRFGNPGGANINTGSAVIANIYF